MWAPEEPMDLQGSGEGYLQHLVRKELISDAVVEEQFCPFFASFLGEVFRGSQDLRFLDAAVRGMWNYFQKYDYKKTLQSEATWNAFKQVVERESQASELPLAKLEDYTTAMRWLYRFLLPISVPATEVDLVHLTVSGISIFPALDLKYRHGTPIVLTEHGVYIRERLLAISEAPFTFFLKNFLIRFSEAVTRLTYHHADHITTVSQFNIPWEVRYGASREKIEVVYNGVDTELFRPSDRHHVPSRVPTVVAAARIFALKDIKTMIRTCYKVKDSIPEVRFLVYGNKDAVPSYTKECESLIEELGLQSNFILCGHHTNPEEIYSEGDISLLTSVSEGFPYTVLESMACGIPVVATAVGGVPEALDETTGRLCPPRNPEALAAAVCELLQDTALRHKLGATARARVKEKFDISLFSDAFREIYSSMVHEPSFIERQIV